MKELLLIMLVDTKLLVSCCLQAEYDIIQNPPTFLNCFCIVSLKASDPPTGIGHNVETRHVSSIYGGIDVSRKLLVCKK